MLLRSDFLKDDNFTFIQGEKGKLTFNPSYQGFSTSIPTEAKVSKRGQKLRKRVGERRKLLPSFMSPYERYVGILPLTRGDLSAGAPISEKEKVRKVCFLNFAFVSRPKFLKH